jgi:hypothetical protein
MLASNYYIKKKKDLPFVWASTVAWGRGLWLWLAQGMCEMCKRPSLGKRVHGGDNYQEKKPRNSNPSPNQEKKSGGQARWLTAVIPATGRDWEVQVQGLPQAKKLTRTHLNK